MRLFLDAHVSGRRIAQRLREAGHDVRAADEERSLDGWSDDDILALAAADDRIFMTINVRDFPRLAQQWVEAGRQHAGCAILVGIDHGQFGTILRAITAATATRPDQETWRDYTCFIARSDMSM